MSFIIGGSYLNCVSSWVFLWWGPCWSFFGFLCWVVFFFFFLLGFFPLLCVLCPILSVSLDCPLLIDFSVFCSDQLFFSNRIGGVMVSVLASSAVDHGLEHRSGHTKDYTIGICCFFAMHAALRSKNKDWLARNQNNVSYRAKHAALMSKNKDWLARIRISNVVQFNLKWFLEKSHWVSEWLLFNANSAIFSYIMARTN